MPDNSDIPNSVFVNNTAPNDATSYALFPNVVTPTVTNPGTTGTAADAINGGVAGNAAGATSNPFAGNYRFPADIDAIDHWLQINIFKYSRANRQANANRTPVGTITLPLPHNFGTAYNASYTQAGQSWEDIGIATLAEKYGEGSLNLKSLADLKASDTAGIMTAMKGAASRIALDSFPGISLGTGVAKNPHLAVLYEGPALRNHSLAYKFVIRSQQESDTLNNIIKFLKYSQAPDLLANYANFLYRYPEECDVTMHYPQYTFQIAPSVFKSIEVDYHGTGVPAYFANTHAPVAVGLTINLMETSIRTKQDFQANNY